MLLAILALEARLETKRNMVAEKEEDEEAKGEITGRTSKGDRWREAF